jgi:hypothetical protein
MAWQSTPVEVRDNRTLEGDELQRAILAELRELNARLARAEAAATGLMAGKGAKWFTLFAKTSGMGSGR